MSDAARDALKARQGKGARYDAPTAPAEDLLLARRGTAFFARKLNELDNAALYGASADPQVSRALIVAQVSLEARSMALALAEQRTGTPSEETPDYDAAYAATLPARALRHLFNHSAIHLNVEFRDLPDAGWAGTVSLSKDRATPAAALPLIRARSIWAAALALGNGARGTDLPPELRR